MGWGVQTVNQWWCVQNVKCPAIPKLWMEDAILTGRPVRVWQKEIQGRKGSFDFQLQVTIPWCRELETSPGVGSRAGVGWSMRGSLPALSSFLSLILSMKPCLENTAPHDGLGLPIAIRNKTVSSPWTCLEASLIYIIPWYDPFQVIPGCLASSRH